MELQQASPYATYVTSLGWKTVTVDGTVIYIRSIPFMGTLAKIQRAATLPYIPLLVPALKRHHVDLVAPEASAGQNPAQYDAWVRSLSRWFRINKTPYLATKTILIDLTVDEQTMFSRFSQAKRRGVRRAEKNGIGIAVSDDAGKLASVKSSAAGMFGGITVYGLSELHSAFGTKRTAVLLANVRGKPEVIAGVYLVFWDKTCYYWIAGATRTGKKLFAPTLLVWEALKLAKSKGYDVFDFVGVFDERMPKNNIDWKGFTKFKEGFGGTEVYYPLTP